MSRNKIFFIKLIAFIALALAVNLVLNKVYNQQMYYFRLGRTQDKQFDAYSGTLKYLMLGNSHNRVDPEVLGKGFCYILPREIYLQTYYKLKFILEKSGKKPEYILLSIDPVNFSPRAENDLAFDGYWKKFLNYPELAIEFRSPSYLSNWLAGNFFSYVGNYKFIYMSVMFRNVDLDKIKNGYFPARNYKNFAREPNRDALGFEKATAYLSSYTHRTSLSEGRYYRKILELCRQHNIHLILLRMPMADEYLKYAKKLIDIEKLDQEIEALTRRYTDDFIILDYRNEFRGKSEYFFNADHVNPLGAKIISRKIRENLVQHSW